MTRHCPPRPECAARRFPDWRAIGPPPAVPDLVAPKL